MKAHQNVGGCLSRRHRRSALAVLSQTHLKRSAYSLGSPKTTSSHPTRGRYDDEPTFKCSPHQVAAGLCAPVSASGIKDCSLQVRVTSEKIAPSNAVSSCLQTFKLYLRPRHLVVNLSSTQQRQPPAANKLKSKAEQYGVSLTPLHKDFGVLVNTSLTAAGATPSAVLALNHNSFQ